MSSPLKRERNTSCQETWAFSTYVLPQSKLEIKGLLEYSTTLRRKTMFRKNRTNYAGEEKVAILVSGSGFRDCVPDRGC